MPDQPNQPNQSSQPNQAPDPTMADLAEIDVLIAEATASEVASGFNGPIAASLRAAEAADASEEDECKYEDDFLPPADMLTALQHLRESYEYQCRKRRELGHRMDQIDQAHFIGKCLVGCLLLLIVVLIRTVWVLVH